MYFRPRRKASFGMIVLFLGVFFAWDQVERSFVRNEALTGTIVRSYEKGSYRKQSRGTSKRFWDVETPDGKVHALRVYSSSIWRDAVPGETIVKEAGTLDPRVIH